MFEDIYFGKPLAESAVKPKKDRKRCLPATIPYTLTESRSEGESGEKSSALDRGKKVHTERESAMDSDPFTDNAPSKKKNRARPLADYTSDEGGLLPPILKKVPKPVVNISRVGDDKGTFKIGSIASMQRPPIRDANNVGDCGKTRRMVSEALQASLVSRD